MKVGLGSDLGRSWGGLGVVFGDLGAVFGRSWAVLGGLGALLGRSWGALGGPWGDSGRSKIDQKIVPKIDPKSSRIATEKNGPNTTPVDVSELDTGRRKPDPGRLEIYRNRYRYD